MGKDEEHISRLAKEVERKSNIMKRVEEKGHDKTGSQDARRDADRRYRDKRKNK
jgi:hypothetical protein